MRRLLALVAVMVLVSVAATGCRHVAGACDCDHAAAAGAPAAINAPVAAIAPIDHPIGPAQMPK